MTVRTGAGAPKAAPPPTRMAEQPTIPRQRMNDHIASSRALFRRERVAAHSDPLCTFLPDDAMKSRRVAQTNGTLVRSQPAWERCLHGTSGSLLACRRDGLAGDAFALAGVAQLLAGEARARRLLPAAGGQGRRPARGAARAAGARLFGLQPDDSAQGSRARP